MLNKLQTLFIACVAVLIVSIFISAYRTQAEIARIRCASYPTWQMAYSAFKNGATWLDGVDRDHKPCENIMTKADEKFWEQDNKKTNEQNH